MKYRPNIPQLPSLVLDLAVYIEVSILLFHPHVVIPQSFFGVLPTIEHVPKDTRQT